MAESPANPPTSGASAPENQASNFPIDAASLEILKGEITNRLLVQIQKITHSSTPLTPEELRRSLRGSAHLGWFVRQRLHKGTISGREYAQTRKFEELTLLLVGKENWVRIPVVLQALANVMHDILDGDAKLSDGALSRAMMCFEEGGMPEPEDLVDSGEDK
ncbi:hypothetical protein EG328_011445 [Venturia inaequalis]|uniref:Uncharacterized protein n=1 Tax=Venturia inaequalis TaxID=5025 RepID=A0A8H3Z5V7_VENIN|nr:hypothetical protein EG328_011445 [Venturia inaequalis]